MQKTFSLMWWIASAISRGRRDACTHLSGDFGPERHNFLAHRCAVTRLRRTVSYHRIVIPTGIVRDNSDRMACDYSPNCRSATYWPSILRLIPVIVKYFRHSSQNWLGLFCLNTLSIISVLILWVQNKKVDNKSQKKIENIFEIGD